MQRAKFFKVFGGMFLVLLGICSLAFCFDSGMKSYTVHSVPVTDSYYYKHLRASITFRKQINELPDMMYKCIHSITISDYGYDRFSHVLFKERDIYLIPEQINVDNVVLHEACHTFDSYYSVSDSKEFDEALEADHFMVLEDKRESFVSLMMFYLKDPEGMKELYPEIFRVIHGCRSL